MSVATIRWQKNAVVIIDQTKLPNKLTFIRCNTVAKLWRAIKTLQVRGAPALGVAAGFGVVLGMQKSKAKTATAFLKELDRLCVYIGSSRPTAVNLFNALRRMKETAWCNRSATVAQLKKILLREASAIFDEDRQMCRKLAEYGSRLIKKGDCLLTICNAGALATADYGTALGVFYKAHEQKKNIKVYACETRPLLQGARLTTWELKQQHIDTTLICDNMAATLMQQGKIDKVFVGADRIALNGDSANKIGTYNLAVLAKYHTVPFYVVAPSSTFDRKIQSGRQIPIEERDAREVTQICGCRIAASGVKVYNPAFDVTPHELISAIVSECGIAKPPYQRHLKRFKE